MKTSIFTTVFLVALSVAVYGQTNTVTAAKVGVGTTAPAHPVHIVGPSSAPPILKIGYSGMAENHIGETGGILFAKHYDLNPIAKIYTLSEWGRTGYYNTDLRFATGGDSGGMFDRMIINQVGNVLIGKASQQNTGYKLDVGGTIRANEIRVNTTGADFVFEKDYKLSTLNEVAQFIADHGHLPEIQSASEMQKEGVDLGKLNIQLLQKVEELTLHLIAEQRSREAMQKQIADLKKELQEIKRN